MKKTAIIIALLIFSLSSFSQDSEHLEKLTKETFKTKIFNFEENEEWKYEGELPAIVDFYADWCGPCKMVAPIMDELAKEYKGKIRIYKVDTQTQQELSSVLGIKSLPSLLFIPKNGKPQLAVGALPKATFVQYIEELLLEKN